MRGCRPQRLILAAKAAQCKQLLTDCLHWHLPPALPFAAGRLRAACTACGRPVRPLCASCRRPAGWLPRLSCLQPAADVPPLRDHSRGGAGGASTDAAWRGGDGAGAGQQQCKLLQLWRRTAGVPWARGWLASRGWHCRLVRRPLRHPPFHLAVLLLVCRWAPGQSASPHSPAPSRPPTRQPRTTAGEPSCNAACCRGRPVALACCTQRQVLPAGSTASGH